MNRTITLPELTEAIASATGISRTESESFIKDLFVLISERLADNDDVVIKGLGRFAVIDGEPVLEPDREFADGINLPFAAFEAIELDPSITPDMIELAIDETASDNNATDISAESAPESHCEATPIQPEIQDSNTTEEPADMPANTDSADITEPEQEPTSSQTDGDEASTEPITDTATLQPHQSQSWKLLVIILLFIFWGAGCFLTGYLMAPSVTINTENGGIDIEIQEYVDPYSETHVIPDTLADTILISDSVEITEPKAITTNDDEAIRQQTAIAVTDTIRRNRYLTTMARQHYGLMDFWVYIYEENAEKLGDPNRIKPGTVVVIPPAEKYGIDRHSSESIRKAKLKSSEIYAPYQK